MRQDTAYAAGVCICGRTLHMRQDTAYAAGDCICGRTLHMQQDARLTLVVSPVSCLLSRLTVRGLLLSAYAYSVQRTNIARTCNMHEAYSCRGLLSCLLSRLTLRGLLLSAYAAGYGAYSCRAQADGGRVATGNWGCGVFGGDVILKAVVQMMAAAHVGKTPEHSRTFQPTRECPSTLKRIL